MFSLVESAGDELNLILEVDKETQKPRGRAGHFHLCSSTLRALSLWWFSSGAAEKLVVLKNIQLSLGKDSLTVSG